MIQTQSRFPHRNFLILTLVQSIFLFYIAMIFLTPFRIGDVSSTVVEDRFLAIAIDCILAIFPVTFAAHIHNKNQVRMKES